MLDFGTRIMILSSQFLSYVHLTRSRIAINEQINLREQSRETYQVTVTYRLFLISNPTTVQDSF